MKEKVIHWLIGAIGTAIAGYLARHHDPFYSEGWLLNHLAWIPLILVVAVLAIVCSLWLAGFFVIVGIEICVALAFVILYEQSNQQDPWPLFTWILHLIVVALFVGIAAGAARLIYEWWRRISRTP